MNWNEPPYLYDEVTDLRIGLASAEAERDYFQRKLAEQTAALLTLAEGWEQPDAYEWKYEATRKHCAAELRKAMEGK